MNELKKVYLDNAASTKVDDRVLEAMIPYFREFYAVPSSEFSHSPGIQIKEAIENARESIAKKIGAQAEEIIFTSGGTESNNIAIKGGAYGQIDNGKHIVISAIEHRSVLESAKRLAKEGFELTVVGVDEEGFIKINELKKAIRKDTVLVSMQFVNHEVGTIQNIKEMVNMVKSINPKIIFHTDAAYATGWIDLNVKDLGVDLLTLTAHKMHGPKGVGALYIKKGVKITKFIDGGFSEFNLRGGTPNVPGIVGFAKAFEILSKDTIEYVKGLRDKFYEKALNEIEEVRLNGARDFEKRHPNNLNLSFKYVEGESVVLYLDMKGISVITGSACFSRTLEPSYILMAMGYSHEDAHGSVRFTFSKFNTPEEIDYTINVLKNVIDTLRRLSPLKGE